MKCILLHVFLILTKVPPFHSVLQEHDDPKFEHAHNRLERSSDVLRLSVSQAHSQYHGLYVKSPVVIIVMSCLKLRSIH